MISVESALEQVLAQVQPLPAEETPILEALGQVLAEDVCAQIDVPPLDNSAMDGYAVRAVDVAGAGEARPVLLRVIANLAAGQTTDVIVTEGTTVRIMTGAPLPMGADAVVQFEHTDEGGRAHPRPEAGRHETVVIHRPATPGLNVRRAGEDIRAGQIVLRQGTTLRPAEVGVLASLGYIRISVHRRPLVAVLSTGDELVPLGQPLGPGQIYNSNSYSIAAQVKRTGGIPLLLGIARDRPDDLVAKLRQGLGADLLITSGGVSMGDFDVVKDVLAAEGEVTFWRVRMKPGKPLAFGRIGEVPHLGLPGNPVSSMVTFETFARPAILKLMGRTNYRKPSVEAVLLQGAKNTDRRRVYLRAIVEKQGDQYVASLTGPQGSGILTSMALANALAVLPEDTAEVRPGDRVQVLMLDWPEDDNL